MSSVSSPARLCPFGGRFTDHSYRNAVASDFLPHGVLIAKQFFGHGPPKHDYLAALHHVLTVQGAASAYGPVADGEVLRRRIGDECGLVRVTVDKLHLGVVVLSRPPRRRSRWPARP